VVWIANIFSTYKADDAGGLTPGKEDNAAGRKKTPQDMLQFSCGGVLIITNIPARHLFVNSQL